MAGETKSLGQKDKFDRFYTRPEVVDFCLSKINLDNYKLIIEPSAGDGAFSHKIPNCLAYDLNPGAQDIIEKNYFDCNFDKDNILVIGNPPFGVQNNLAIQFFNHSAAFARTIAFIVPKSFDKVSIQNRLSLDFILTESYSLSPDSFTLEGNNYSVPCVFQIWERGKREKIKLPMTNTFFTFVKSKEEADFRIQRVGGNAGKAFLDKNGAQASNYYVKNTSSFTNEELVEKINKLIFPSILNTVGPRSLSKGEMNLVIEEEW